MQGHENQLAKWRGRKGARRRSEVPKEVLQALNEGCLETVNLVEWLALDARVLLTTVLDQLGIKAHPTATPELLDSIPHFGVVKRDVAIGKHLGELLAKKKQGQKQFERLASHASDTVRCWATQAVSARDDLGIGARLAALRPFATDRHFGVREGAWMAFRPHLSRHLEEGLTLLDAWARDENSNVRRFAIEVSRPRGVWCEHLAELKENPRRAAHLLEANRRDPVRYVQLSVANWLNDASKSHPDWVREVCNRWRLEEDSEHTHWIIHHAQRTLRKENESTGRKRGKK